MSTNGNGQGTELAAIEAELLERFPSPEHTHQLLIHVAARTELYHLAAERVADEVAALNARVGRIEDACPKIHPLCDAE